MGVLFFLLLFCGVILPIRLRQNTWYELYTNRIQGRGSVKGAGETRVDFNLALSEIDSVEVKGKRIEITANSFTYIVYGKDENQAMLVHKNIVES